MATGLSCASGFTARSCVVRKAVSCLSLTATTPVTSLTPRGRSVLLQLDLLHTELFVSVWSVVRISWPSWHCPSLLHPQTAALYLELVHAFCLRRYAIAASECVKVRQLCVILAGLVRLQSCPAPRSASTGVTMRSCSFVHMSKPDHQARCTALSSSSALMCSDHL